MTNHRISTFPRGRLCMKRSRRPIIYIYFIYRLRGWVNVSKDWINRSALSRTHFIYRPTDNMHILGTVRHYDAYHMQDKITKEKTNTCHILNPMKNLAFVLTFGFFFFIVEKRINNTACELSLSHFVSHFRIYIFLGAALCPVGSFLH